MSQKLEYACRAMACLAKHYDGNTVVKLEDIAQREHISSSFLVQILNELKRSELVESKRGKAGGYVLARPPAAITVREVVQAVEPGLLASPAPSDGDSGAAVTSIWNSLSGLIADRLGAVTLEQLAAEAGAPMYHI